MSARNGTEMLPRKRPNLPARARRYVLAVDTTAVVCVVVLATRASWNTRYGLTSVVFIICGALSMEVYRRIGVPHRRPDRPYHDLTGAFLFPAALLLPPIYAALIPLPLHALLQVRVAHLPMVKRIFNTATAVLICAATALIHDYVAGPLAHAGLVHAFNTPRAISGLFLSAVVYLLLNQILVSAVIRRVAPATPWRALWFDAESWILSAGEVCAGMLLAVIWVASPFLTVFALVPILLLQRAVVHTHLVASSRHDSKTGLANPSWWRHEAGRAVTRARHGGESVAVVVVDLDKYKRVNDRHGHLVGDQVLTAVADTMLVVVRPGDIVGRFGGDEFTVLLAGTTEGQALRTADRLRERLAAIDHTPLEAALHVTASVGVAVFGDGGIELDDLLRAADGAMYEAKGAGGNCVRLAREKPSPLAGQPQLV